LVLALAAVVLLAWMSLFTGTPLFGPTLVLKNAPVASIELSMLSTNRAISASNQCAQVLQVLRTARAGPVLTTPCIGNLTVYYVDGTTNRYYLQPGSRIDGLDLVDATGSHTVSMSKLFRTFQTVGLVTGETLERLRGSPNGRKL
jgi:hypothetical protein